MLTAKVGSSCLQRVLEADTEVGLSHQCLGSRGLVRRENPFNQGEPAVSSSREREADFSQIREKFLLCL